MMRHWPRWILASIQKHFDDRRDGLKLFVEGTYRNTSEDANFIELRVDGPSLTEISKDWWKIYVEVNILVQATMSDTDFHKIYTDVGTVLAAFTNIELFKYGTESYDNGSQFGCLRLLSDARGKQPVRIYNFGQVETSIPLMQSTLEGHYVTNLEEGI